MAHMALILPLGLIRYLWFYCLCLLVEFIAIYFFVASIWYWVATNLQ